MEGEAAEAASSGGGLDLGGHLERVLDNLQSDPEVQLALAQELEEAGVNPVVMKAVLPEGVSPEDLQKARQAQAQAQAQEEGETPEPQPQVKTVEKDIEPEDLLEFVDEIAELAPQGEDMTLGELREFGEDNPGVVKTAIDMKL